MVEVSVCIGSSCHLKGSHNVIQTFQQLIEQRNLHDMVDMRAQFCMKQCSRGGVAVSIDGDIHSVAPEHARHFFDEAVMPRLTQRA